jgi:tetratricopeptide (TPR) repeat protein
MKKVLVAAIVVASAVVGAMAMSDISGQQKVSQARALYAAADYEQALAVLKEAADEKRPEVVQHDISVYTFECLVALDRTSEAEQLVEQIVVADPGFRTTATDMPPKAATFFRDVRQRILPRVVEQQYVSAKSLLEQKRYAEAASQFGLVLSLLEDADMQRKEGTDQPVSMRVLAQEFRDLASALASR